MSDDKLENEEQTSVDYKEPQPYIDLKVSEIPRSFTGKIRITGIIVEIDGLMISIDDGTGIIKASIGRDVSNNLLEEGRTVRAFIRVSNKGEDNESIWVDILQDFVNVDLQDYWDLVKWERNLRGFPSVINQTNVSENNDGENIDEENPFF